MTHFLNLIWFGLFLTILTTPTGLAEAPQDRLVYGEAARLKQFDPYTVHEASGQRLADLLFDDLVDVGPGGQYQPSLAKSWTIEDSGTSVVIRLREQIYWHPQGDAPQKEVTADDVVTTIRLLQNPDSDIPNADRFQVFKTTEVIGTHALRIFYRRALADPVRPLLFKVLPDHILGKTKALGRNHTFVQQPIGTGPYKFVKTNNQGEILLDANPNYFGGVPQIKQIIMKPFADQSVMAQSLMYQSLDLVTYLSPKDLKEIRGDRQLQVVPYDALSFSFVAINTQSQPLNDKRVRQAISHALNRKEMLQAFFQGEGMLISGPFSPTSWAYNLDVEPYAHNPERARKLLGAAGLQDKDQDGIWEDASGKPVQLDFVVPIAGESQMLKRVALALQAYLAEVGLTTKLRFLEWQNWKEDVLGKHDYDLTIASWDFDDSANIVSLFHSSSAKPWGNNFVQFQNPKVDSMLTESQITNDFDKRRAIYKKLHAIIADEVPYAFLWTLKHHAAHRSNLVGVQIEPFAFFEHVASWTLKDKDAL
jgi:peptide/nickel transport system substrate-binding protein